MRPFFITIFIEKCQSEYWESVFLKPELCIDHLKKNYFLLLTWIMLLQCHLDHHEQETKTLILKSLTIKTTTNFKTTYKSKDQPDLKVTFFVWVVDDVLHKSTEAFEHDQHESCDFENDKS